MDAANDTASLFLKIAVSKGMIDDDLAKQVYQEYQATSRDPSLILLERGILTSHLAENLRREVQRALGPKTIGGFRIIEKIGQGGMGIVYKATQMSMDRVVALKVLAEGIATNAEFAERFLREAHAAAKVDHPNVVTVYDVGKDGGLLYLAMQYVPGGDADRLARDQGGRLSQRRAATIIRDAARGLGAIHEAGLIHRDIKPANIFLAKDGMAKLADLGLSRSHAGEDRMTMTGNILGTPAFMAPEQARGEADLDIRCDLYSLGATLYVLLTGRPPFAGSSPLAVAAEVIKEPFPDPALACPGLDAGLCAIIRRCTAKARSERHASPAELVAALEAVLPCLPETVLPLADEAQAATQLVAAPDAATVRSDLPTITDGAAAPTVKTAVASAPADAAHAAPRRLLLAALILLGVIAAAVWWSIAKTSPTPLQVASARPTPAASPTPVASLTPVATAPTPAERAAQERLAQMEAERQKERAASDLALKEAQERLARTEAERLAAEQAMAARIAADEQERKAREALRLRHEQAQRPVLAAIAACPANADDSQVAQTRRVVEAYLADHGQEPAAAKVALRWQKAQDAIERQRRLDQERQAAAREAQQKNQAAALTEAKEPWMAARGRDGSGSWADLAVAGAVQRFRLIKAGTFNRGSPPDETGRSRDEEVHAVTLSRDFWLADSECTQALWQAVMGQNPSQFTGDAERPVELVSGNDTKTFLSALNGKVADITVRLPTEAEWEYACRAGSTGPYAGAALEALGWYELNSGRSTHRVKTKAANAWGLFDMHGNVQELCEDSYAAYPRGPITDPGNAIGMGRVVRGGSWNHRASDCRSAYRSRVFAILRNSQLGFRLAITAAAAP